jgi:hypothetical protein
MRTELWTTLDLPEAGRAPSDVLLWLGDILWGGRQDEETSRDRSRPSARRIYERFLVIPDSRRPRLLVPLASNRAAAAAWRQGNNATTRRIRLAKALLGVGFRVGLAQQLLRDRLEVRVPEYALPTDLAGLLVEERLREVLGRRDLHVAVNVGTPRMNRKPLIQVLTDTGEVVAYAKLGWDDLTRRLVRNEVRVLGQSIANARSFDVPSLLFAGQWRGMELLVSSPVSHVAGFAGRRDLNLPVTATNEVAGLTGIERKTLSESSFFTGLCERAAMLAGSRAKAIADVLGSLAQRYEASTLTFGSWHGDWAPWNMAWHEGRLFVWDWERSHQHVPVGFDALHFSFQVARRVRGKGVDAAANESLVHISSHSEALNVSRGSEELLLTLYLLTLLLRYEEASGLGARAADDISSGLLEEASARVRARATKEGRGS